MFRFVCVAIIVLVAACGRVGFDDLDPQLMGDAAPRVWTPETSGTGARLYAIWASSPSDLYTSGDGVISHSTGNGDWTDVNPIPDVSFYGVGGTGPTNVYVVGNIIGGEGSILHRTTGTFTTQTSATAKVLNDVWSASSTDVYAVGYGGTILHTNGSGTWTPQISGTTADLLKLWGTSATDIYAAGTNGTILHSTGTGTWTRETSGSTQVLVDVWGLPGNIYVTGHNGTILHSTQPGVWAAEAIGTSSALIAIFGTGANEVFVCGGNEVYSSSGDGTWKIATVVPGATILTSIWSTGSSVYVVGEPGVIVRGR